MDDLSIDALLKEATAESTLNLDVWDPSNAEVVKACVEYQRLKTLKDALSAARRINEEQLEKLADSLVAIFQSRGIKNMRVEGVGLLYTTSKIGPKVYDNLALNQWAEAQGEGGLITHAIHFQRLKAFLEDRINQELPIPDERIVEITRSTTLALRK